MATGKQETKLAVKENDVLKEFSGLLQQQGMGEHSQEFVQLFQYVVGMQVQLNAMAAELQDVRGQLAQLQSNQPETEKGQPAKEEKGVREQLADLSERTSEAKKSLLETASQAIKAFKQKGKAAMCRVIQKGLSGVKHKLQGTRERMAYMVARYQKTADRVGNIGNEFQQIGNSVSNVGRLITGKDAKEAQGDRQGVGLTRAAVRFLKNMMGRLQENINATGRALEKLDSLSDRLENTIREADRGERTSVTDKLSQMKDQADSQKESPQQAVEDRMKGKEECL